MRDYCVWVLEQQEVVKQEGAQLLLFWEEKVNEAVWAKSQPEAQYFTLILFSCTSKFIGTVQTWQDELRNIPVLNLNLIPFQVSFLFSYVSISDKFWTNLIQIQSFHSLSPSVLMSNNLRF